MKQIFLRLLLLVLLVVGWRGDDPLAWDQVGFNFRCTLGYVTDGTNECFVSHSTSYPNTGCTSAGDTVTMGWTSGDALDCRDRDSGLDRRLAGLVRDSESSATISIFRVNLPTGGKTNCTMRGAWGDPGSGSIGKTTFVRWCDGSCGTPFATVNTAGTAAGHWHDATGVDRTSAANWVSGNAAVTHTFTNSFMTVEVSGAVGGGTFYTDTAHIFISCAVPASSTQVPVLNELGEL